MPIATIDFSSLASARPTGARSAIAICRAKSRRRSTWRTEKGAAHFSQRPLDAVRKRRHQKPIGARLIAAQGLKPPGLHSCRHRDLSSEISTSIDMEDRKGCSSLSAAPIGRRQKMTSPAANRGSVNRGTRPDAARSPEFPVFRIRATGSVF